VQFLGGSEPPPFIARRPPDEIAGDLLVRNAQVRLRNLAERREIRSSWQSGVVDWKQTGLLCYISLEERIPKNHPLRPIRAIVSEALVQMDGKLEKLYSQTGRPSIAPERLIRALLLQLLYTIRSGRLPVEQLEYNLLFRCSAEAGGETPSAY